ncbi:MAG: hypothetical protein NUV84_03935, partial [Candidatus Uhrbacteria bacterium]|nr:hypothetical protein [Candidatus Uhrbacteria bacterium]
IKGLVRGVYAGNIGGAFIDTMANLISGQLTQAYKQAWSDEDGQGKLPDYLLVSLNDAILKQYNFVDQYYRDIIDARVDETSIEPLLARSQLWSNRWTEAYNEAVRLITLNGGGNLVWIEGGTKDKCNTCVSLNGIVARASEWDMLGVHPQGGPNNKLKCKGFSCQCRLAPTTKRRSPNAYGRIEEIILAG